ncbi:hypothetical protein PIB30_052485 [Stylosanthes scabra]|uniref:Uncharacterized protein n=1 Tax=Stylosanthes scabra TaxID=79078 RepID=A0ABU6SJ89_9FABA|nr:hypothetical protein [Stylosanthes scabra]
MGEDTINVANPSPTKTKTLEDDRRTEDVIQEWEDECYVKPTNEYEAQSEGLITSNPMETTHGPMELESSTTSIPPGFGNVDTTETASEGLDTEKGRVGKQGRQNGSRRHMKIVLKLNDRLKENARKQKEARKRRTLKQRKLREIASEGKWSSSEEEIEDSDVEANEIWGMGMRTGLVTDKEDRAKNYLSSKLKEVTECSSRRYKQTEGRDGKKLKEPGPALKSYSASALKNTPAFKIQEQKLIGFSSYQTQKGSSCSQKAGILARKALPNTP